MPYTRQLALAAVEGQRARAACPRGGVTAFARFILFAGAVLGTAATARAQVCPNKCSGNGTCVLDTTWRCNCFDGFAGADCSLRACPTAPAWTSYPTATDAAHTQLMTCANAGACNSTSGECACDAGFTGLACDKLKCPGEPACSGRGLCMSMRQAALGYDGFRLTQASTSYALWDADRVFGCVCDPGYAGADCSQRVCPTGDDPLTTAGQSAEVQTLTCTCAASCSGYVTITYAGRTRKVLWNAVATAAEEVGARGSGAGVGESLQSQLRALRSIPTFLAVSYSSGTALCTAAGTNVAAVTFVNAAGDAPALAATAAALASTGSAPSVVVATLTEGSTESAACSNRGVCDTTTGECTCFTGFGPSDGSGATGTRPDCGFASLAISACPVPPLALGLGSAECAGRGICSGAPTYTCTCFTGYAGGACEERECPRGRAWWDEAVSANVAHTTYPECSARGVCNRATGVCTCASGFTGAACDRTVCPTTVDHRPCSGRGRCLSMRELADVASVGGARAGAQEVQSLTCSLTSGSFTLTHRFSVTSALAYDASAGDLQAALQALPTVGIVSLSAASPASPLCDVAPITTRITFITDTGDQPELSITVAGGAAGTCTLVTTQDGGAQVTYGADASSASTWDADMLYGCHCDGYPDYNRTDAVSGDAGSWYGSSCAKRACPVGPDVELARVTSPYYLGAENQTLTCAAAAGSFTLSFRGATTAPIAHSASASAVRTALEALPTVGVVAVVFDPPDAVGVCSATAAVVSFLTELGDLPEMVATSLDLDVGATLTLVETNAGTGRISECSGKGVCDSDTGLCKCFTNYVSSDGFGRKGRRGECGAIVQRNLLNLRV